MKELLEQLAALAELQKQATPGPWLLTTINANPRGLRNYVQVVRATDTGTLGGLPAPRTTMQLSFTGYGEMHEQSDGTPDGYWPTAETKANAQLIANARALDFAALHTALAGAASTLGGGAAAEAACHSVELAQISEAISHLHAQNRPAGELLRRLFNDARRGKTIREYNDVDPLPTPAAAPVPVEAGGWVAVGERLPTDQREYLVYVHPHEDEPESEHEADYVKVSSLNFSKTGFYVCYSEDGQRPLEEVTHWREMPAAPTQTGNEQDSHA